jgi:ketosteroid isomerase-like protein
MQEHPNAATYRRTADAFRARDQAALATLIAEDVVWHVPGGHSMAGEIRGRTALLDWLGRLPERGFWLSEHDVLATDEHVCALSIMGARREGIDIQTRVVSVFHYRRGLQLERWFYPEDPVVWDRIFDG